MNGLQMVRKGGKSCLYTGFVSRIIGSMKGLSDKISSDERWKSFPKVPNLLQYVPTGKYYGRIKVLGKIVRRSLETDVFTTAKLKLPDFIDGARKEILQNQARAGAPAPVLIKDAWELYVEHLKADHALAERTLEYRDCCLNRLEKSWPGIKDREVASITELECKTWGKKLTEAVDAQYFNN